MPINPQEISDIIRKVANKPGILHLHEPEIGQIEIDKVVACLEVGQVSGSGAYIDEFEVRLSEIFDAKHVVAVMNGTAALHLSLKMAGVEPGDEVLTQSLTFAATANAIWNCHAIPHFVDIAEKPFGIDIDKLSDYLSDIAEWQGGHLINKETKRRISALVPMHVFGHSADMDRLVSLAKKYKLQLIVDAAEALGSKYKGRGVGAYGDMCALSFNGNKIITTGGGGAVTTNDDTLAAQLRHVATTAKLPHKWAYVHDQVGYNYRMPNLNAALGCAQLERFPAYLDSKQNLAKQYQDSFANFAGVSTLQDTENCISNHWLNALILDQADSVLLEQILATTHQDQIYTRPIWTPLHQLSYCSQCPRSDLSVTEDMAARIINLPSSPNLGYYAESAIK